MIDIEFIEIGDGGDVVIDENGYLSAINDLRNQVYLALWGGQNDWWGNDLMKEENKFLSTFETLLNEVALNSSGLSKLIEAAKYDLKYLEKYADIEVNAAITDYNRLQLDVTISQPNNNSNKVTYIWDGFKNVNLIEFNDFDKPKGIGFDVIGGTLTVY